jgi:hypothetical protein
LDVLPTAARHALGYHCALEAAVGMQIFGWSTARMFEDIQTARLRE